MYVLCSYSRAYKDSPAEHDCTLGWWLQSLELLLGLSLIRGLISQDMMFTYFNRHRLAKIKSQDMCIWKTSCYLQEWSLN